MSPSKSPSKSAAMEIVEDSEEEEKPKPSPKKSPSEAEKSNDDETNADDDEEDEEGEFEIEAILDAKLGRFPGGRTGYLVKWKNYGDQHNSWVNEEDAGGAQEMIDEFWDKKKKKGSRPKVSKDSPRKARQRPSETKTSSPDVDAPPSQSKRKKSAGARRKSKPEIEEEDDEEEEDEQPKPKKAKTTPRKKTEEVEDTDHEGEYMPMDATRSKDKSWEKLVDRIDTIEKADGKLKVFFTLNNGDKVVESSNICAKHFPQKLIQFYESNLRWREADE